MEDIICNKNIDNKYKYKIENFISDCVINSILDYNKILEKILYNDFGSDYGSNDCWDSIDLRTKTISVTSEGQSSKEDLLELLYFIEFIILNAKNEECKIYLKYKKIFDSILIDINKNTIIGDEYYEVFEIRILENINLYKSLEEKYIKNWKI